jgi:hypothetical protein
VVAKKSKDNPFFKKVLDSQRAFAQRAGQWQNDYMVDFKMAYNRYFGQGQEGLTLQGLGPAIRVPVAGRPLWPPLPF